MRIHRYDLLAVFVVATGEIRERRLAADALLRRGRPVLHGCLADPDQQLRQPVLSRELVDDLSARSKFSHVSQGAGGQTCHGALEQQR